jgi:uncharacterized protein YndB with AHSA1/START domain
MSREIRTERDYPYPPERVWRALTDSKAMAEWLMPNDFVPKVGHKFRFDARPQRGWRGYVDCEVLEVEEPRKLSYTWVGDENHPPTTVIWTLEPIPGGTRLRLCHGKFYGFGGFLSKFFMGSGWKSKLRTKLADLIARLDEGTRPAANSRTAAPVEDRSN